MFVIVLITFVYIVIRFWIFIYFIQFIFKFFFYTEKSSFVSIFMANKTSRLGNMHWSMDSRLLWTFLIFCVKISLAHRRAIHWLHTSNQSLGSRTKRLEDSQPSDCCILPLRQAIGWGSLWQSSFYCFAHFIKQKPKLKMYRI